MDIRYDLRGSLAINGTRVSIDLWRDGDYYMAEIQGNLGENLIVVGTTTREIQDFLETAAEAFRKAQE